MFFTAPMRFLRIILLEKDFQKAIDLLADYGWMEINRNPEEISDHFTEMNERLKNIDNKINHIVDFLNISKPQQEGKLRNISELEDYFNLLFEKILPHQSLLKELQDKKNDFIRSIKELEQFKNLKISKSELEKLNFLYFTSGYLSQKDLNLLTENMKGRLIYTSLSKDFYLLLTSKKGKWTLESELKKLQFKEKEIPFKGDFLPADVYGKLHKNLDDIEQRIFKIETMRDNLILNEGENFEEMVRSFLLQETYQNIFQTIEHSGSTAILEGWIEKKSAIRVVSEIQKLLGNKAAIILFNPQEMEEVKTGLLKVPVVMDNPGFFKSFEKLVFNYGAPQYGMIDPTFMVAFSFLLLFGIMFGDLGQGLVIFLSGLMMTLSKKADKMKDLAPLICYAGFSSMVFGYLYGAFFCFEHLDIFKSINSAVFGINRAYFINTSFESKSGIITLVSLTIGLGVIINLIGILINIINKFKNNKIDDAIAARNGLAGFILLLSLFLTIIDLMVIKANLFSFLKWIILSAVILIFIKDPLFAVILKKDKIFHHGFGMWVLHSIIELLELLLVTLSNNLSFMRVGVFAIAHGLLSFIFVNIAQVFGVYGLPILIMGNLIIIGIEGLIVYIQTIRLLYYEFFSKFFTEQGKKFFPFKITRNESGAK